MSQENVEAVRRAHAAFNRGGPFPLRYGWRTQASLAASSGARERGA